jgi:hypothetical protein
MSVFPVEEYFQGWLYSINSWSNAQNYKTEHLFEQGLSNWKLNAQAQRAAGQPIPDPPMIPQLMVINVEKARECFMEWWNADYQPGLAIRQDYIEYANLPVDMKDFALGDSPAPQPSDPVAGPDGDIAGQFLVASGDTHKAGEVIMHPVHGRLFMSVKPSPFGNVKRWRKA